MAQTEADREAILEALSDLLGGIVDPPLSVIQGPPWAINEDRQCNYWYEGDEPDPTYPTTLNSRNVREKFRIQVFWLPPAAQQLMTDVAVRECWQANRSISQALNADSTLGGTVLEVAIGPTTAGVWAHAAGNQFYSLQVELQLSCTDVDSVGR
jgi:hypothetical protein